MAYPLQCYAGYSMPIKAGKFEIIGYFAAPEAIGTAMEIAIVDDTSIKPGDNFGKIISSMASTSTDNTKTVIAWERVGVGYNAVQTFGEPIKTRHGISIYSTNIKGGSLCVYVR